MGADPGLNILIIHANWRNRGDEAAIRAMIDSVRSEFPVSSMRIMVAAETVEDFPYDDIGILPIYPFRPVETLDSLLTLLLLGRYSLFRSGRKFLRAVDEADVVIHAPGGPTIGDTYGDRISRFNYLYRILFSRVVKRKKVFFYAPSMGPFNDRLMNPLRSFILKRVGEIVLREDVSAKHLKDQLGIESTVTLDSAYQNQVPETYVERYPEISDLMARLSGGKVVGITVTDLLWHPILGSRDGLKERIVGSVSSLIDYLVGEGTDVLLIPQLFGGHDDSRLLEELRAGNPQRVTVLPSNVDAYGQQVVISKLSHLVGMRYHSNIFAAKAGVPFVPICYEHKMTGFVREVGFGELSIDIDELNADALISKVRQLEARLDEFRDQLRARNPDLVLASRMTNEALARMLGL